MVVEALGFLSGGEDTLHWLLSLPVPSFVSLFESYSRVHLRRAKEYVYHTYVASQGTGKSLDKYIDQLEGKEADPDTDARRFIADFGHQFGAKR